MRDETIKTILEYEINQSSVNRAVATAQRVEASQRDLSGVLGRYGAVARASITEANAAFDSSRRELEFVREAVERLNAEIDDVPASAQRAERALDRVGDSSAAGINRGGTRRSAVETVDNFGSFSSQVAGALAGSESGIANAAGLVGDLAGGIERLGSVALVGAGALGAVSLAMQAFNDDLETQRSRLEGATSGLERYFDATIELNSEQAEEQLKAGRREIAALQQERSIIQAQLDSAFAQAQGGIGNPIANLASSAIGAITNFQLGSDLGAAIGDLAVRAVDASNLLPTAQLRERLNELDSELQDSAAFVALLQGGLENNAFAYNDNIQASEEFRAALETEVTARMQAAAESAAAAQRWADAVKAAQDARRIAEAEFRAAQQQAATDSLKAAQQGIGSAADAIARTEQALADSERRASQRQQDIGGQRDEAIARIEADAGQERIRRAEETAERLRQIERDYGRDRLRAIADRDAVAAVTADEARADQLDDQRSADARAEREAQRNRDRQLAQARESADRQLLLARSAATEDLMIRRRAVEEAQSEERAARAALLMTQRNYNAQFVQEAATAGRLAADAWKSALAGLSSGRAGSLTVSSLTGMAGTGRAQTFTINVNGATQRQITATSKQQAMQVFEDILRSSGVR